MKLSEAISKTPNQAAIFVARERVWVYAKFTKITLPIVSIMIILGGFIGGITASVDKGHCSIAELGWVVMIFAGLASFGLAMNKLGNL